MKYFLITQMIFWFLIISSMIGFFFFYRFYYFFRDPKRVIPNGNNLVSPADGYILYIRKLKGNEIPFSIKKGQKIMLNELIDNYNEYTLLIGVFMSPLSVHYNRFPFTGKITNIYYKNNSNNKTMMKTFLNIIFNITPYTDGASYLLDNERNITILENDNIKCAIVQIADKWVKKIVNNCKVGEIVDKGTKLGMIRMGSQCDIFLKIKGNYRIAVKERQYVKAGSSILIELED